MVYNLFVIIKFIDDLLKQLTQKKIIQTFKTSKDIALRTVSPSVSSMITQSWIFNLMNRFKPAINHYQ